MTAGNDSMTVGVGIDATVDALDAPTRALVRLAAVISVGSEAEVRDVLAAAMGRVDAARVEEIILQSYLFAGFPRTLNAAREWRRISGRPAPAEDEGTQFNLADFWRTRGERTCATVYGPFYEGLRRNVRLLHPALDAWMVVEGYGKVLGRPGLDLVTRELCIVGVCAAGGHSRQLHSHLHGALHAGASPAQVGAAIDTVADLISAEEITTVRMLWRRVERWGNRAA
ncbi:MAG: carboxymuconolactone decarboxylase family protein, partial [Gemmatimonadaceae bacterium]